MLSTKQLSQDIEQQIASLPLPERAPGLYEPVRYALAAGGKRLRPLLCLEACLACGGDPAEAMPAALALEMFHNFTLVHDDIMDGSDTRRGRPSVAARYGSNQAILSGDAMLTLAACIIAGVPAPVAAAVAGEFNEMALRVYEGQQLDTEFETRKDVTVDEYFEMISLKTGALLASACRIGAMIAGAPEATCRALYDYGMELGLAFQLRDDWLDTFGDPLEFGKEIGGDIVNGKKTWLLITALEESDGEVADILREDLEPEERIRQIVRVYRRLEIDTRCSALVKEYSRKAIDALRGVDMDGKLRDFFISLAKESAERSH